MKKGVLIFILAVILISSGCVTQQTTRESFEKGLVTEVIDGDTLTIQGGDRVRLLGIDTPEKNEQFYLEAKEFLESRVLFKEIELERDIENKDRYDRLLRWVWLDGSLVNAEIVGEGLAIAKFYNEDEKYQNMISQAEQQAIEAKKGIWKQIGEPITKSSGCVYLACSKEDNYAASKNSNKYHKCGCQWAQKIKKENLICFETKEEAELRGYETCSSCD
ncbi:MAG: thermonuclease family protein [archaeon]|nr:MAG: thermonuclease family protein [archaeon]